VIDSVLVPADRGWKSILAAAKPALYELLKKPSGVMIVLGRTALSTSRPLLVYEKEAH
jgi:hypothetical protein